MILIVEDDPQVAKLIELLLHRKGKESEVLSDGKRALERIREIRPSMVFADLGLKGLTGDELCKLIKSESSTRGIPFIVLSGDRDIQEKAGKCGADDFLGKPFEFEDLTALLEKYADDDQTN